MIGPKIKPELNPGDFHLVVADPDAHYDPNDPHSYIKCYDHTGLEKWKRPALAKGVYGGSTWQRGGDTPPGLYKLGQLFVTKFWESKDIWNAYGKYCWDMVEMENQENVRGRAGVCLHSAGSAAQPYPLHDYQTLTKTLGCVRMHNIHTAKLILPLTHTWRLGFLVRKKNTVYLSVWQDHD